MASLNSSIKIHEHCYVAPPPTSGHSSSYPLTFFDLIWLRFHPVERTFFYSFSIPTTDPSFFFDKVVPKLKTSLSLTLKHFLLLAGNIVWPSDFKTPIIQHTPDDVGVSLIIAESEADFNHILDNNSPHEAAESRSFVPNLESSDTHASVITLQITLFPNKGFSIGISTHHAVLDGKSSTMFIKAWASLCQIMDQESQSSPSLVPELVPFLDREIIKDPTGLDLYFANNWTETLSKLFPTEINIERTLKILPFPPKLEDSIRAKFEITRADLEKIKTRVLSKWDNTPLNEQVLESSLIPCSKPQTLSTFVLTCAYVSVCIAKAIQGVESNRQKFVFAFTVDCRGRLEQPVPNNYFGNCVWGHFVDTKPTDYIHEEGVVIVAKNIHNKIKKLEKGVLEEVRGGFSKYASLQKEGIEIIGIAGSNRFGVYGIDFGWGKPVKVEIPSIDRGLTFGIADSKDGKGGIEVGLVLNKHVMDLFDTLFHAGLCID
ncbi:hypothetical protein RIF29_03962 [Crotalaria pallida]|uniref:Uncharacterized protein n=1 Tax=Crotalaria pallida TaxID=3830 RepID=A0AAN9P8Z5_CROPI